MGLSKSGYEGSTEILQLEGSKIVKIFKIPITEDMASYG
jgi:hypothetical protein